MTFPERDPDRIAIVTNPAAGRGDSADIAAAAIGRFLERGLDVTIVEGGSAAESLALVQQAVADGIGMVAVAGGDGLAADMLPAVAGTGVPLGLIPTGTGNDLARELGVPLQDPVAAADIIAGRRPRRMDLGKVGDHWFATVVAAGFDAKVNQRANALRWPRGRMRYNAAIAMEFAALRPISYSLELDDGTTLDTEAVLVAVGNTSTYGGGMRICAPADPADGLLDITIIRAVGRVKLALLFRHMYDAAADHPAVSRYRARAVRVAAHGPAAVYADGEPRGELPLIARIMPGALSVLAPS